MEEMHQEFYVDKQYNNFSLKYFTWGEGHIILKINTV
jgi:hypothetical protein